MVHAGKTNPFAGLRTRSFSSTFVGTLRLSNLDRPVAFVSAPLARSNEFEVGEFVDSKHLEEVRVRIRRITRSWNEVVSRAHDNCQRSALIVFA